MAPPIQVEAGCLQCHSRPSAAPVAMVKRYGSQNGFGWNAGEVVGAQIISVPDEIARRGLRELLLDLAAIFLLTIALIDAGLFFIVIRPLRTIPTTADRISQGDMDLQQLEVHGGDEVAEVTRSFNRMHTSLKKAMDLLNEKAGFSRSWRFRGSYGPRLVWDAPLTLRIRRCGGSARARTDADSLRE